MPWESLQENYLNHQPSLAQSEAMAMQVIAKAADAFSAGDLVNTRIRTYQAWYLAPHAATLSAVYPASYMRCDAALEPGAAVYSNTWLNRPRSIRFSGLNGRKCRAHFMISLMKSAGYSGSLV
jgi:hypothetical protein